MKNRLIITVSDIHGTKSYNFHQFVKKILLTVKIVAALLNDPVSATARKYSRVLQSKFCIFTSLFFVRLYICFVQKYTLQIMRINISY